ncbi:hypothetical protein CJD36_009420 [Flavipsychrobacter stenotrophus]|uniref:TonB-dependent receptor n=1 Tax=Flavipsychrobacter stenotrophus TaxID=2077091 RepID=A0A2S7SZ75_9BACT|nr:TonB dependent receptor [Flavipsychrobacter stenotrophus]PQJ11998.1 hypothetical protein CJD36_009420 [Flavipsychrobacter stenotrophus]
MLKKLLVILTICCCFAITYASAENYSISGKVQDSAGHPVDMAIVVLHMLPDSAVVKGTYTDSVGNFILDQLSNGRYYVSISAQGYRPWQNELITLSNESPNKKVPLIKLSLLPTGLKEVEVTARKSLVVQKADRTVVNVDAMLSAASSSALDALERCPGVQVNQDGDIRLRGKQGVTVFVNDKPTYLSGTELANYLKTLPASAIDQIELMTNPPANYDAAGNGGIINIKIKRKGVKGFNGGINASLNQGHLTRYNNNLNLNYRNNKVSAFLNAGFNTGENYTDLDLNRTYLDGGNNPMSYFNQKSYFWRHNDGGSINAGADYSLTDKTIIGVTMNGMAAKWKSINDNNSYLLDLGRQPDSTIISQNNDYGKSNNLGINLNYKTQFNKSGHEITADADYLVYNTNRDQAFYNTGYSANGVERSKDLLTGQLPNRINIYALKTDYALPLAHQWKFSSGLKTSYTATDNKAEYNNTINNITSPDYNKSNQFIYKENINAAYINMSHEAGKLSMQAGLRFENTTTDGHQLGNPQKPDSAFTRNYNSLFPTVYFSYKFDTLSNNQLGINYGRRINRPYYEDLNPFINPMDKFTYYVGNPFLKPSFNHNIALSHTYKNKITTSLSYSTTVDDVNETIEIVNGIYYSRSGNIGTKTFITLSVDGDFDPTKWLNLHVYSEVSNLQSKSNFYNGTLSTGGNYWFIAGSIRVKPAKGWEGEIYGNYRSSINDAQFIMQRIGVINLVVRKKISDAFSIRVGINDILRSQVNYGKIGNLTQATANWINRSDSRNGTIALSYKFGKAFNNTARHNETGADAEKNRVKG